MSEDFNIEELLKESLIDGQAKAPPNVFDRIEATILKKEKRKKRLFYLLWLGIGLGILGAGIYIGSNYFGCKCPYQLGKPKQNSLIKSDTTAINKTFDSANSIVVSADSLNEVESTSALNNLAANLSSTPLIDKNGAGNKTISKKTFNTQNNTTNHRSTNTNTTTGTDTDNLSLQNKNETSDNKNQDGEPNANLQTLKSDSLKNEIQNDSAVSLNNLKKDTTALTEIPINDTTIITTPQTDSTIISQDIDSSTVPKSIPSNFGLLIYGGSSMYDLAVFKPYFTSGKLSQNNYASKGIEFGIGMYKNIGKKLSLELIGNFNQKNTGFKYDLMINESDYFNLYLAEELIPIENLDDPNECNCFLAKDVSLAYKISTVSLNFNTNYSLIQKPKHVFGPQIGISTNFATFFEQEESTVINFNTPKTEFLTQFQLKMGLTYDFKISNKLAVGIRPTYSLVFAKKSVLYAKTVKEILIPIHFKLAL